MSAEPPAPRPREIPTYPAQPLDHQPTLPRLLLIPEAAAHLRVHRATLRRWIASDRLPVVRIGRAVRIRPEDLTALVEASSTAPRRLPLARARARLEQRARAEG